MLFQSVDMMCNARHSLGEKYDYQPSLCTGIRWCRRIIFTAALFTYLCCVLFLPIRPQQKRAKEHREMVNNVKRGDKIVTSGGLLGTVSKSVEGQETVEVEIAKDIKVSVMRTMIADLRDKKEARKQLKRKRMPRNKGWADYLAKRNNRRKAVPSSRIFS